eukprot:Skav229433  [mRNA]  locus=scaffold397:37422:47700:- [translate_table: standard]
MQERAHAKDRCESASSLRPVATPQVDSFADSAAEQEATPPTPTKREPTTKAPEARQPEARQPEARQPTQPSTGQDVRIAHANLLAWHMNFERMLQVVRHILNDLERFGAKPIDFKAFLDIMTAKMGERDTKEDRAKGKALL